jgi:SAM-dependent methyltransferase
MDAPLVAAPPEALATEPVPRCALCGQPVGRIVHANLTDRLFGAPGTWTLRTCSDPACGHLWLDPRPTPEAIGRAYAGYYTHAAVGDNPDLAPGRFTPAHLAYLHAHWGYPLPPNTPAAKPSGSPFTRAELDFSVLWQPFRTGGTLFEIGCGNGWALELMQRRGWKVAGIDPDPAAVASARARGLDVTQALPSDPAVAAHAGRYDAVVAVHVLEHVYDPVAFVKTCKTLLRPGGRLTLVTPNAGGRGRSVFGNDWRGLEPPRHLHLFDEGTLAPLLRAQGFKQPAVFSTARDAHNIYVSSRRLGRGQDIHAPRPLALKVAAKLFQISEMAANALGGCWGEELVANAQATA